MISCAPADLVKAAQCFTCLTHQQREAIKSYLLCQWAASWVTWFPSGSGGWYNIATKFQTLKEFRALNLQSPATQLELDDANQQADGQITEILNLQRLTSLQFLSVANNKLTTLDVSAMPALTDLSCASNKLVTLLLTGTTTLRAIDASNNSFPQSSVDAILVEVNSWGTSPPAPSLDLIGGTSASPSAVGVTAKNALAARGWTVTTN